MLKELAIIIAWTGVLFIVACVIVAGMQMHWASGCRSDGYVVESYGYGVSKNYLCVDPATGQYIDGF